MKFRKDSEESFDKIEKKFFELLELIKFTKWENRVKLFKLAEKNGFHILKTGFYSPIPIISEIIEEKHQNSNSHFDWNEESQIKLLNQFKIYSQEFQQILEDKKYQIEGDVGFGVHDAPIYYSFIRHKKPQRIIEVGAGNSTRLAVLAAEKNGNTEIVAIDPFVRNLRKIDIPSSVQFIEKPVQMVPLSEFKKLTKDDILFIDSSHIVKQGSDVNFLYLQVLPILKSGVIIHIHDIFLPSVYPKKWLNEKLTFFNEQFLLHAFLLFNKDFEILFSNNFMRIYHGDLLTLFFDTKSEPRGGSFWMRKK